MAKIEWNHFLRFLNQSYKKFWVTIVLAETTFFQKYFHPPTIFARVADIFLTCPFILQANIRKLS